MQEQRPQKYITKSYIKSAKGKLQAYRRRDKTKVRQKRKAN